jgi:predicted nucleic acid-binding protein
MCIVVDTNVFQRVFDTTNAEHANYKEVRNWIYNGKGKIVFGGTTYFKENIANSRRNRNVIAILKGFNKVHEADAKKVDEHEIRIKGLIKNSDFDDPHIAAIICTCGCKLIATWDKASVKYLKMSKIYKGYSDIPRFYLSNRNKNLLVDASIAECCKPVIKLRKAQQSKI